MTQTDGRLGQAMDHDEEPTAAEIEGADREDLFLPEEEATPDTHPSLYNISAGMIFKGIVRPDQPQLPDYVAIPMDRSSGDMTRLALAGQVGMWNMLWEAGQFRRRFFDEAEIPKPIAKIAELGDVNVVLVPRTRSRYFEYAPLFHLLPKSTLDRFGLPLPLLRRGQWPFLADASHPDRHLPHDFAETLARAWAATVWPYLNSGSGVRAFSQDDPIRLLAHNLDFWVPPVTSVIQQTLGEFPEVDRGTKRGPVPLEDGSVLEGAVTGNPRMGGPV